MDNSPSALQDFNTTPKEDFEDKNLDLQKNSEETSPYKQKKK
jgi:hypothetical protein